MATLKYYKTVNINTAAPKSTDTSVLVIYTGGTIGMDLDPHKGTLLPFDFEKVMEKVPELARFDFELTVLSFPELIDSSDVNPGHWRVILRTIQDFYKDYDGFVVLHGTDTMAYTASVISFMIENLGKPVVFTGAQLPIGASRTDARENLISALEIASAKKDGRALIPEVCIYFDHMLLRGNRAKKVQNFNFTAFESYNHPALAIAGINIDYNYGALLPHPNGPVKFYYDLEESIIIIKLFPGITEGYFKQLLTLEGLRGIVIETFGSGNMPTNKRMLSAIKEAIDSGIAVMNVSQSTGGAVVQGKYATSLELGKIGVISGADITTEAAVGKLMFVLANFPNEPDRTTLLRSSLRGEIK